MALNSATSNIAYFSPSAVTVAGNFRVVGTLTVQNAYNGSQGVNKSPDTVMNLTHNYHLISSNGTIQRIDPGNWTDGTTVRIRFDDTVTLVHNDGGSGQMYLAKESGVITRPHFVLVLTLDSNTWFEDCSTMDL